MRVCGFFVVMDVVNLGLAAAAAAVILLGFFFAEYPSSAGKENPSLYGGEVLYGCGLPIFSCDQP